MIKFYTELGKLVTYFVDFIDSVPSVIWSGLVASVVTLFGVAFTLHYNTKQRKLDRELDLKREVYLEAIDSISKGIHRIANIWSINVGDKDNQLTDGMEPETSSALKVLMVSSNETFQKGSELINLMNAKLVNLYLKSAEIYFLDQKFKIEACFLKGEFEKVLKQVDLETKKYQKKMELLTEVASAVEEVNQKALHVIISIRKELNLPIDEKSILEVGRKNTEISRDLIKKCRVDTAKMIMDLLKFVSEVSQNVSPSEQGIIGKRDGSSVVEPTNDRSL